jgi:DNA-binding transcriptional ArsR family regulator
MKKNKNAKEDATVIVLPETDEQALCVELTGVIRREDHELNLRGNLKKIIEKKGWYNLLVKFSPSFKGWEESAAAISLKTITEFAKYGRRHAYVNPSERDIYRNKMSAPMFGGETRYFNRDQFQEALDWVKSEEKRPLSLDKIEGSTAIAAELLKLLSNEKRLIILCRLYDGEKSVTELMEYVGLNQSALSQHLAILRMKNLVTTRRAKQTIFYSLADRSVRDLMQVLGQILKPDCNKE